MTSHVPSYHGYRFPPEIISHAVWLSHRTPQQAVEKMTGGPSKSAVRSRLQTVLLQLRAGDFRMDGL